MNWEDEDYAKLYTRDTPTWLMLPWQGRALLPLMIRKADGAGIIDTGTKEIEALALTVMLPREVVEVGLVALIECGTVSRIPGGLELPKYIEAQQARKTEAAKKRGQRSRHRDQRRAEGRETPESPVPTPSHGVPTPSPFSSAHPQLSSSSTSAFDLPGPKKRKRKSQVELPADVVPPKPAPKHSLQQKLYALFIDDRDARCVELGLQPTPADEQHGPAYLNAVIGRWLKEWEHVEASEAARAQGFTGAESRVRCLFQEYLDLDWPAECKQRVDGKDTDVPQPYPFRVLGSEKVWRKLAAQLWPDDSRPAEGVH